MALARMLNLMTDEAQDQLIECWAVAMNTAKSADDHCWHVTPHDIPTRHSYLLQLLDCMLQHRTWLFHSHKLSWELYLLWFKRQYLTLT